MADREGNTSDQGGSDVEQSSGFDHEGSNGNEGSGADDSEGGVGEGDRPEGPGLTYVTKSENGGGDGDGNE